MLNHFFGMNGIVWTQVTADMINVVISYIIYYRVQKQELSKNNRLAAR